MIKTYVNQSGSRKLVVKDRISVWLSPGQTIELNDGDLRFLGGNIMHIVPAPETVVKVKPKIEAPKAPAVAPSVTLVIPPVSPIPVAVKPVAKPVTKPVEVKPVVKTVEVKPVTKPVEVKPVAKPAVVKPVVTDAELKKRLQDKLNDKSKSELLKVAKVIRGSNINKKMNKDEMINELMKTAKALGYANVLTKL